MQPTPRRCTSNREPAPGPRRQHSASWRVSAWARVNHRRSAVTTPSQISRHLWSPKGETSDKLRGRVFAGFDILWQSGRLQSLLAGGLSPTPWGSAPSTTSEPPSSSLRRPPDGAASAARPVPIDDRHAGDRLPERVVAIPSKSHPTSPERGPIADHARCVRPRKVRT